MKTANESVHTGTFFKTLDAVENAFDMVAERQKRNKTSSV